MPSKPKRAKPAKTDLTPIYDEIHALSDKGHFDKIVTLCSQCNDATTQAIMVVALIRSEQYTQALQFISQNDQQSSRLQYEEAYCLYRLNRAEEALSVLQKFEKSSSTSEDTRKVLLLEAQILYRLEQFQSCLDTYNRLLDMINKEDEHVGDILLNIQAVQANLLTANRDQNFTLNISAVDATSYEALYNHACYLLAANQPEAAISALETARQNCSEQYAQLENRQDFSRELFPILTQLAYAHQMIGQFDIAYEHYQTVLRLQGEQVLTFKSKARPAQSEKETSQLISSLGTRTARSKMLKQQTDVTRIVALNNLISMILTRPAFFAALQYNTSKSGAEDKDVEVYIAQLSRNVQYDAFKKQRMLKMWCTQSESKLNKWQKNLISLNEAIAALHLNKFSEASQLLESHKDTAEGVFITIILDVIKAKKSKDENDFIDTIKNALTRFPKSVALNMLLMQELCVCGNTTAALSHLDKITSKSMSSTVLPSYACLREYFLTNTQSSLDALSYVEDMYKHLKGETHRTEQSLFSASLKAFVRHLAYLYCQRGDYSKAAQLYESAVKGEKDVIECANWVALLSFDRPEYAEKILDTTLKLTQRDQPVDIDTIESGKGVLKKKYKSKNVTGSGDKQLRTTLKSNKRKRKPRLVKGIDPSRPYIPDPDRWLPKRLRSTYKPPPSHARKLKKLAKMKSSATGAHQGGVTATDDAEGNASEVSGIGGTGSAGIFGKVRGRKEQIEESETESKHEDQMDISDNTAITNSKTTANNKKPSNKRKTGRKGGKR